MECFFPLPYADGLVIILPISEKNCIQTEESTEWVGTLPTPNDLNMTHKEAGFYYGVLGIICAYAFIHHFRSL